MAVPPAYLDECVHRDLVEALRKRGFTVISAAEERTFGLDDETQLRHATARGCVLITYDDRHFLRLHRVFQDRGEAHGGIVVLPQKASFQVRELRAAMMLEWIAGLGDCRSRFFRWGQLQQLVQAGYRPPGYADAEIRLVLGRP